MMEKGIIYVTNKVLDLTCLSKFDDISKATHALPCTAGNRKYSI
jgi:hypothetical protein